ncbi:hypothetical protein CC2G_001816 [Coprinopsis cinerea AmutBmut pab1-1]|nr:hypothetical protein CC2G_001816 [Coprinopsis cinerea AmutBmut pab1-1]
MRVGVFFTSLLVLLPTILASPTHLYRRDYSGESGSSGSGSGSEVGNSSGSGSNVAYNVGGVYGGGSGGYNYDGGAGDGGGYGGTNVEDGEGDGGDNEGQRGSGSGGGYDYDEGGNDDEGSAGGAGEDDGDNGGDDGGDNGEDGNGNDEGSSGDDDSSSEYDVEDVRILSYALSYEYLATAFYEDSFSRWSCQDFENFGIDEWAYKRYEQIYKHRKAYVKFLESAIEASGAELIPPCTYNFDYSNDVNDFVNLSQYFELAGTSLYNGVLGYIHNKRYASVIGSILGVQARHSAWIHSTVQEKNPWNTAFEASRFSRLFNQRIYLIPSRLPFHSIRSGRSAIPSTLRVPPPALE